MHTFSPAKMWISGLKALNKPFIHLHTQYNKEIPWNEIDMNFMNTNQSAHGGREFGFMVSRMKKRRKVIVGYWQDEEVLQELGRWIRVTAAWHDAQGAKIARFGDNMRNVAVTEGDKVEAEMQFGYSVNGYGIGDLVEYVNNISAKEIENEVKKVKNQYKIPDDTDYQFDESLNDAIQIELGMRAFLKDGNFKGFTTTFENLHGLKQLPGLAVQRLMADGYGFGAEGDWKTAALVRAMKVMSEGLTGGTSFMEQYTYHLADDDMKVLGAHMLEVCETLAENPPSLEVHPLGIGGKDDPARLIFDTPAKPAINASIIDLGNRFRMVVNDVEVVKSDKSLPKLPVARVVWKPQPDLKTAVKAWILSGGAHHTGFSQAINAKYMEDFAEIAGIEYLHINQDTTISKLKDKLKLNEIYYKLEG
jgi:L-arabinose isomerase